MVALCLSLIDFIYLFMRFKETLAPEKRLKSLQAALNQAITYVNPISLFNFQSLDNLKEEELASIKTIGKNLSKGQLVSKGLVLNSFKKTNDLHYYDTSGRLVFVQFLEEFEDNKNIFRN